MTLAELKQAKREMEDSILQAIRAFEQQTGGSVQQVNLRTARRVGDPLPHAQHVEVDVHI